MMYIDMYNKYINMFLTRRMSVKRKQIIRVTTCARTPTCFRAQICVDVRRFAYAHRRDKHVAVFAKRLVFEGHAHVRQTISYSALSWNIELLVYM